MKRILTVLFVLSLLCAVFTVGALAAGEEPPTPVAEASLTTPYGTIPAEYADVAAYPIVRFNADGSFNAAYTKLDEIFATAAGTDSLKTWTLYARADIDYSSNFYNFASGYGTRVLDLGGHTLKLNTHFLNVESKWNTASIDLTIKNGTINTSGYRVMRLAQKDAGRKQGFAATFTNVVFEGISSNPAFCDDTNQLNQINSSITFNDCTFKITSSYQDYLFNFGAVQNNVSSTVTVKGGQIISENATFPKLYTNGGHANKTIVFDVGSDGQFTKIVTAPVEGTPADVPVPGDSGARVFTLSETTETQSVYTIVEKTPYGNVPSQYASITDYPVLVFNAKNECLYGGTFSGAYETYMGMGNGTYTFYLRTDVRHTKNLHNIAGGNGHFVFDLNGNTLTLDATFLILQLKWNVASQNYTVKNGTINTNGKNVVLLRSQSKDGKTVNVNFDNITFTNIKGSVSPFYLDATQIATTGNANVTLNNCKLGLSSDLIAPVFSFADLSNKINSKITVNGGSIVCDGAMPTLYDNAGTQNSTFVLGKGSDGKYPVVSASSANEGTLYSAINDSLVMLTKAEEGSYAFISVFSTFLRNVNLDVSINFNLYIPTTYTLAGAYDTTEIDGVEYYVVTVKTAPKDATGDNFISLTINGVECKYNASLVNYMKALLKLDPETSAYVADSQRMAKYVLYYVKNVAVDAYKEAADTAAIDSLLGDFALSEVDKTIVEAVGNTENIGVALHSATLDLNHMTGIVLALNPSFVGTVTISMNGIETVTRTYEEPVGYTGEYVLISDIPVFKFRNTITISVNGEEIATYNLATYVNNKKTDVAYAVYAYAKVATEYHATYATPEIVK